MKVINIVCYACGGAGQETNPVGDPPVMVEKDCPVCSGSGVRVSGQLSDDLIDFLKDMNDKINDIFEKVNE